MAVDTGVLPVTAACQCGHADTEILPINAGNDVMAGTSTDRSRHGAGARSRLVGSASKCPGGQEMYHDARLFERRCRAAHHDAGGEVQQAQVGVHEGLLSDGGRAELRQGARPRRRLHLPHHRHHLHPRKPPGFCGTRLRPSCVDRRFASIDYQQ